MIKKTKEYNVLEVADLEKAVSEHFGRKVSVSEMDVEMIDSIPADAMFDDEFLIDDVGIWFYITVDGDTVGSYILQDKKTLDDDIMPDPFLTEEYIFAFDTAMFKSYTRSIDNSD